MQVYCTVPTLVSICTYLYVFAQHPLAGVSTVHVALPQSAVGVSSARPGMATGDWRDNLGPRFPVPGAANTYDHAPLPPPSLVPGPEAEPPPWSAISRLVPAQPPLPRSQVPAEVPCAGLQSWSQMFSHTRTKNQAKTEQKRSNNGPSSWFVFRSFLVRGWFPRTKNQAKTNQAKTEQKSKQQRYCL